MHWTLEYLEKEKTISVRYTGTLSFDLYVKSFEECIDLSSRHGVNKYLVDTRNLEPVLTTTEIYDFPKIYDRLLVTRNSKIAMILSDNPAVRKNLAFFQTVCRNRGYLVELFNTEESALKWLAG